MVGWLIDSSPTSYCSGYQHISTAYKYNDKYYATVNEELSTGIPERFGSVSVLLKSVCMLTACSDLQTSYNSFTLDRVRAAPRQREKYPAKSIRYVPYLQLPCNTSIDREGTYSHSRNTYFEHSVSQLLQQYNLDACALPFLLIRTITARVFRSPSLLPNDFPTTLPGCPPPAPSAPWRHHCRFRKR